MSAFGQQLISVFHNFVGSGKECKLIFLHPSLLQVSPLCIISPTHTFRIFILGIVASACILIFVTGVDGGLVCRVSNAREHTTKLDTHHTFQVFPDDCLVDGNTGFRGICCLHLHIRTVIRAWFWHRIDWNVEEIWITVEIALSVMWA